MKILFISAFYPPHVVGGWEQLVRDINHRLQQRGHETHVLTSQHGVNRPVLESSVSRLLHLESDMYHYVPTDFLGHRQRLKQNLQYTEDTIRRFQPDVVFVHVMFNLSRGIPWLAEQLLPGRVVYYVANDWPHAPDPHTAYWRDPARSGLVNAAKKLLSPLPLWLVAREKEQFQLQFSRVLCVSEAVKKDLALNAGIDLEALHIVYNGVETETFVPAETHNGRSALSLLYAGSLVQHKGVHTAVNAMALLKQQNALHGITLHLVGSGHPDYEAHLHQLVQTHDLADCVYFHGRVPRADMPAVLQQHDILLFPSIWEEPLSRMMQEGMAAGLVVVGTLTGGSGELLVEGETGLAFPPDNADVLAQRIQQLDADRSLLQTLAENGRQEVVSRFGLDRMIDEIDQHLAAVVAETAVTQPVT